MLTPLGYGMQDASYIVKDKDAISLVIANKHEDTSLDFKPTPQDCKESLPCVKSMRLLLFYLKCQYILPIIIYLIQRKKKKLNLFYVLCLG